MQRRKTAQVGLLPVFRCGAGADGRDAGLGGRRVAERLLSGNGGAPPSRAVRDLPWLLGPAGSTANWMIRAPQGPWKKKRIENMNKRRTRQWLTRRA